MLTRATYGARTIAAYALTFVAMAVEALADLAIRALDGLADWIDPAAG